MKTIFFATLCLTLAACSKPEPPPAPASEVPSVPAPVATAPEAPAASATAAAATEPATEADFEDEAAQQVTAATLDSQLDALEKEIQAD